MARRPASVGRFACPHAGPCSPAVLRGARTGGDARTRDAVRVDLLITQTTWAQLRDADVAVAVKVLAVDVER